MRYLLYPQKVNCFSRARSLYCGHNKENHSCHYDIRCHYYDSCHNKELSELLPKGKQLKCVVSFLLKF